MNQALMTKALLGVAVLLVVLRRSGLPRKAIESEGAQREAADALTQPAPDQAPSKSAAQQAPSTVGEALTEAQPSELEISIKKNEITKDIEKTKRFGSDFDKAGLALQESIVSSKRAIALVSQIANLTEKRDDQKALYDLLIDDLQDLDEIEDEGKRKKFLKDYVNPIDNTNRIPTRDQVEAVMGAIEVYDKAIEKSETELRSITGREKK